MAPKINLAYYQNAVPVLRELAIVNESEESLQDLELTLSSEPAFIKEKTWRVDVVEASQKYHLKDLDIELDGALLGRLTEAETAQVSFSLSSGGEVVVCSGVETELLARNQWGGIDHMPDMIAAFVQPNEPAVERLLKKAAEILRENGKNSAINGYEGGPRRAWELASAIWTAVGSMGLDYSMPPASFEHGGQKIRGPGQIADSGIATCLDTVIMFCAAIEQCGLNPLLVFTNGHALAGVWLRPEEFTTVVVDDVTALRKRVKLKELVLFETTLVTQRPCPSFGRAIEAGSQHLSEDKDDEFELAIDVRRARLQRIKPLASARTAEPSGESAQLHDDSAPDFEEAPDLPDDEIMRTEEPEVMKPEDRLERWQRKLLDLSLKNRLLNFHAIKRTIKLEAPTPGRVEDLLADGEKLKLLARPDLMDGSDLRSQDIHEARTNEDVRKAYALDALERNEVLVSLQTEELSSRLVELYRFARAALQEGGSNTLFLAMGFLSWTRDDKDSKRYRAPLLLIPVTLHRKSVRSGFALTLHDDEPRFNPTLIEMLRQDFNLELPVKEGELSKDDHGLDIAGIWNQVAYAIKDIRGWEVVEDVVLSTFSFAKYLMWKDLMDRTDQLKQSPVVKHLIDTPREPYESQEDFPDPRSLDKTYGPEQVFCPLPADSSQLSAVIAAAREKDFVLIGPPGTGKSQTIANIISQCLAEQKTVLFVSEKMEALNVVYRRLCEVELGEFCLELHSNKARKLDVIRQLERAWGTKGDIDVGTWKKEAGRLKALRDQLNEFVDHLHCRHRNGLTPYDAIGRIVGENGTQDLGLSWSSADMHDEDDLRKLEELVEDLGINAREVGSIADSPLAVITHGEWSPRWRLSMIEASRDLISRVEELLASTETFIKAAGLPELSINTSCRNGLVSLSLALPATAGHDWRFALRPDVRTICADLNEGLRLLSEHGEAMNNLSEPWSATLIESVSQGLDLIARHRKTTAELSAPYSSETVDIDVGQLSADWEKAEKSWGPLNWLGRRRVRSALSRMLEDEGDPELPADVERLVELRRLEVKITSLGELGQKTNGLWVGLETQADNMNAAFALQDMISAAVAGQDWTEADLSSVAGGRCGPEMAADLEHLKLMRAREQEISELDHLREKTAGLWAGLGTHANEVVQALEFQETLAVAISQMATTTASLSDINLSLDGLIGAGNALLEPTGPVPSAGIAYRESLERFQSALNIFASATGTDSSDIMATAGDAPEALVEICRHVLEMEPKLHAWCAWRKVRVKAITSGLAPLVDAVESGAVELDKVGEAFRVGYAHWWINSVVDGDDVLRNFVSATHEKRIADFRALDDRISELTRSYIRAGLCAGLPDQQEPSKNSDWGILRHEMQKKKRHMPLRELMNRIPQTITKLAPCLLMSPLSIAQYLSAETAAFDIVVFDEASQITIWDALGAIARGKRVIMVGDPKQLPPTNFFGRAESDMDDDSVEADLESILDECLGANLPYLELRWHYRSRHESLIAFSNNRYYKGALVTFPSPFTEDSAVSLHHIEDGVYEKGVCINKSEARKLVRHIIARLKDPDFIAAPQTIGVVTFNAQQQKLIEDMLDAERRKDPAIERFFAEDIIEPIFVKNLESVQGDQRDVMYFSVTYGPDLSGSISMNLGPMNKAGGERRLNVAITRARHKLLVFSSLRPEQFDLSRTQAEGVRDLKHFMEFADRGPRALAERVLGSVGDFESPFEEAVAEALTNKGWQVHPQVGVSAFRIDLGIVDPDAPGRYLAGVECDGATYHRSATARDRDKLREQVLRGLGWDILRIWSTDWWIDAAGALEKVHSRLERLLEEKRSFQVEAERKRKEGSDEKGQNPSAHAESGTLSGIDTEARALYDKAALSEVGDDLEQEFTALDTQMQLSTDEDQAQGEQIESGSAPAIFAPYHSCEGQAWADPRTADIASVTEGLCEIIQAEGPMMAKRCYDIYLRGCGIKRMGRDLKSTLNKALQRAVRQRRVVAEDELKVKGLVKTVVRITDTPQVRLRARGPRRFDEIPPSEILVASQLALEDSSVQKGSDEHFHAILALFDLKRLTAQTGTMLLEVIEMRFDYVTEWFREHESS